MNQVSHVVTALSLFFLHNTVIGAEHAAMPDITSTCATFITESEGIREYKLSNGLQILILPKSDAVNATVNMVYRVGLKNETDNNIETAHTLEHLLVARSTALHPDWPEEIKKNNLRRVGNTAQDYTSYKTLVLSTEEKLNWLFAIEAERMSSFTYSNDDVSGVVAEVIDERDATERNAQKFLRHKALTLVAGKTEQTPGNSLTHISLNKLQKFWEEFYLPQRATLVVGSKLEAQLVMELVQKNFCNISKRVPLKSLDEPKISSTNFPYNQEIVKKRSKPILLLAYRTMGLSDQNFAAVPLLAHILQKSKLIPLNDQPEQKKSGQTKNVYFTGLLSNGILMIEPVMEYGEQKNLPVIKTSLLNTVEKINETPVNENELTLAKESLSRAYKKISADNEETAVKLTPYIATGNWQLFFKVRDDIQNFSILKTQENAVKILSPANRIFMQVSEKIDE
ncbi:M16 family metallopeptidase [Undibacterium sp. JH2W]|uniref:M16 family metallopeptidase n=1 Tax=Undibacterium sp. JH2W TaxID=3413037 RepID=UPI003BF34F16